MKINFEIQHLGQDLTTMEIEKKVKAVLKERNVKLTTVDTLEIYYQPENCEIYYQAQLKDGTSISDKCA